jgi:hypothetical protein
MLGIEHIPTLLSSSFLSIHSPTKNIWSDLHGSDSPKETETQTAIRRRSAGLDTPRAETHPGRSSADGA